MIINLSIKLLALPIKLVFGGSLLAGGIGTAISKGIYTVIKSCRFSTMLILP